MPTVSNTIEYRILIHYAIETNYDKRNYDDDILSWRYAEYKYNTKCNFSDENVT